MRLLPRGGSATATRSYSGANELILRAIGYSSWAAHLAFFVFFLRAATATSMAERETLGPVILACLPVIAIATLVMIVHSHVASGLSPSDLNVWRNRFWFMGTLAAAWYLSCSGRRLSAPAESSGQVRTYESKSR
jgi:hypothetical protein